MARVLRFAQTQAGGACTASERAKLDEYLLGSSPEGALQTLTGLQETRVGKYEYTLAVGRLYERSQYMRKRGFPPESNIFWKHIQREADELNLSNVEHMMKAMRHVESRARDHYHRAQFEIRFLQKPALWWQKLSDLTSTLDDQIYEAPVPLADLKRILSDTALEKLTRPELVEELSIDHLQFAKQEALKSFRIRNEVSFVESRTYDELGFEIGRDDWIQRIDPSLQRRRGRQANLSETNTQETGNGSSRTRRRIHRRAGRPY